MASVRAFLGEFHVGLAERAEVYLGLFAGCRQIARRRKRRLGVASEKRKSLKLKELQKHR